MFFLTLSQTLTVAVFSINFYLSYFHSFLDQFNLIFQDLMVCHSQTLNSQNNCKAVEKIKIQSE